MFGWFKKEKWRHVTTITVLVDFTKTAGVTGKVISKVDAKVYYHLHESDRGNRKFDVGSTVSYDNLARDAENLEDFHTKIVPWLNGRYDPDIPSYSDIDLLDVEKKLSK